MHEEAKTGIPFKRKGGPLIESQSRAAARLKVDNPPSYGAQHRQDALWKGERQCCNAHKTTQRETGGNRALPPGWHQFDSGIGTTV